MRTRIYMVLPIVMSFQGLAAPLPLLAMQVITPAVGLHFGSIVPQAGSSCSIDASSNVSGECDISNGAITTGQLEISDLLASSDLQIVVTGGNNGQLSFLSTTNISGTFIGTTTVNDGETAVITTDILGSNIDLVVYGQLSVLSNITSGATHTINYTVSVIYQ